jgi:hypothetical protein
VWLWAFAVRRWQFTLLLFALLIAIGISTLHNIPRAEDPEFHAPVPIIVVAYPGADPADIERTATATMVIPRRDSGSDDSTVTGEAVSVLVRRKLVPVTTISSFSSDAPSLALVTATGGASCGGAVDFRKPAAQRPCRGCCQGSSQTRSASRG